MKLAGTPRRTCPVRLALVVALFCLSFVPPPLEAAEDATPAGVLAARLVGVEGVRAGLCVHVGCGDGRHSELDGGIFVLAVRPAAGCTCRRRTAC